MAFINCTLFKDMYDLDPQKLNEVYSDKVLKDVGEKYNVIENGYSKYEKIKPLMYDIRKDLLKETFLSLKKSFFYHPWIEDCEMTLFLDKNSIYYKDNNINSHIWDTEDIFSVNWNLYDYKDDYKDSIELPYFSIWNICMPFKRTPYNDLSYITSAITFSYHNNEGKYIILNKLMISSIEEVTDKFFKDICKDNIKFSSDNVQDMLIELKYMYNVFDCKFWKVCEVNRNNEVTLF